MDEEKGGGSRGGDGGSGGGGGGGDSSRVSMSFEKAGDRQRFTVELRPGETTIVSWKKLIKDANRVNGSTSVAPDPPIARPALESHISSGQPDETELNDEPHPNRFSAVIEKIERLYMGKNSSDEEDLDDIPDDDQYDTEDSFIDDAELDEYFQVDNSALKHDGFFVNRGKLERINEPTSLPNQQPKKRRRKDMPKAHGESNDSHLPSKHVKSGKMAAEKSAAFATNITSDHSQGSAARNDHYEDVKYQNQVNASLITSKKKSSDIKTTMDQSMSLKASNGDASLPLAEAKDTEKQQKSGLVLHKNLGNRLKEISRSSDTSHHKYSNRNVYSQAKNQLGRPVNSVDDVELSARPKEKNDIREHSYVSESKHSMQIAKASHVHRKDSSSIRPKGSILEKAIRELEKMVAESRPPTMEVQDTDTSQAVKRRLPREIKQKLAKVARLAASHGKISKELLNRLMSILGHLMQLRTLKRNLKIMINSGLSAKQEKDDRFQQIKREVVEMIKLHVPVKEFEQQAGASDDFQEFGSEEKGVLKRRFSMDSILEDKICDLYDLYVDGLDEDAGPQIRKLYAELAQLWPNGYMDNHGIKRAICRAKERKRALYSQHKDQEKLRRKKLLVPKSEETAPVESSSMGQPQYMRERLPTDSGSHSLNSPSRPVSNTASSVRISSPSMNGPGLDRLKQEKVKVSSSTAMDDARVADGTLPKKKIKRRPEELGEAHFRPEKLAYQQQQGEEKHKSHKQTSGLSHKSNLQSAALPSFLQLS